MNDSPTSLYSEQEGQTLTYTYDFVLLPNQTLTQKAILLSTQLTKTYSTRFTLDKKIIPHYSIYMAQLEETGLAEAKKRLKNIAATFVSFDLQATHYWQDPTEGFFEVQYERTQELISLQEKIIHQINPLRQGRFLAKYPPGYNKDEIKTQLKGNALAQFQKYGYPETGEDYRPHMTFTRLTENTHDIIDTDKLPAASQFCGNYPSLGLFVMGENGTCVQKIATFSF